MRDAPAGHQQNLGFVRRDQENRTMEKDLLLNIKFFGFWCFFCNKVEGTSLFGWGRLESPVLKKKSWSVWVVVCFFKLSFGYMTLSMSDSILIWSGLVQELNPKHWIPMFIFIIYLYFFGGTGVWTQGLVLAKQVLCGSNHTSSSLYSGYF
jgi:hypothetical protein